MPSDSSGNYSLVSSYFVQNGDTVLPVQHNPVLEDVASALTNRFMKDGRTVATGNLQMGGFKITGLVDGSDPGDSVRFNQIASIGSIAAAATMDIGAEPEPTLNVTGTGGPVTSLGSTTAGVRRTLVFADVVTLTHNATSLILPGGANITTAAGDVATFVSEGSGNWRGVGYQRAGPAGQLHKLTMVTSSSTHNFDARSRYAEIWVVGAGGGGGGVDAGATSACCCAAGGSSGAVSYKFIDISSISSATLVIGSAGTPTAGGSSGPNGGSSSYSDGVNTLLGTGGLGGGYSGESDNSRVQAGPAGREAAGGQVNIDGTPGGSGSSEGANSSGAVSLGISLSGAGASSPFGAGGAGRSIIATTSTANVGLAATGYGAGGGGAARVRAGSAQAGGKGSDGVAIIKEYL